MQSTSHPSSIPLAEQAALPLADTSAHMALLRSRLTSAVKGREDAIDLLIVALYADGHVLLEDYPGSGKTTLARVLGESLDAPSTGFAPFRRVQFTPDLLPGDITGSLLFLPDQQRFEFRHGPVFSHILLADEINRTSPKVQSALLEAMAEKQVTVDNTSHLLDSLFMVIATQNPLDVAGTYPLPTPQLDRFLFKIRMHHIPRDAEMEVLAQYPAKSVDLPMAQRKVNRHDILRGRHSILNHVTIAPEIKSGLVDFARALREDPRVLQGPSTRSLVLALPALAAHAVLSGRDYVAPHDFNRVGKEIFEHRIQVVPGSESTFDVLKDHAERTVERWRTQLTRGAAAGA